MRVASATVRLWVCVDASVSSTHATSGGDKTLKFLQQLCAATVAQSRLDYSTFKDEPLATSFRTLHTRLAQRGVTVGRVVRTIPRFLGRRALVSEFAGWVEAELLAEERASAKEEAEGKSGDETEPDV